MKKDGSRKLENTKVSFLSSMSTKIALLISAIVCVTVIVQVIVASNKASDAI